MDYIFGEVERALQKCQTRDPYELLDAIGAVTNISYAYSHDGLKGYCTILNRISYAVINGNLCNDERRVVAGHEAAHLILHRQRILGSPIKAMRDFNLYDNSGWIEREANAFLADYIMADEDVLDTIESGYDFFGSASELRVPNPLLAFKLYSMMQRGYKVRPPVDLESKFLGR